jgi:Transposase
VTVASSPTRRSAWASDRAVSLEPALAQQTDKVDAATLCELLHAGFLPSVFSPDEWTRSLRRRLQRRSKLVRARTRAKNELHAHRRLDGNHPGWFREFWDTPTRVRAQCRGRRPDLWGA